MPGETKRARTMRTGIARAGGGHAGNSRFAVVKKFAVNGKLGFCPVCAKPTAFYLNQPWYRENYHCMRCGSSTRWRALIYVMTQQVPNWRKLRIHESSPGGGASAKIEQETEHYTCSHFFPDVARGAMHRGFRCEDLENLTFDDNTFDIFLTQDVFEHVLRPEKAFKEVMRVVRPGGCHIFTVPWNQWRPTAKRVVEENGKPVRVKEPVYHGNPISANGSLVITDWGYDMQQLIQEYTGCITSIYNTQRTRLGIEGECLEVFITKKLPDGPLA